MKKFNQVINKNYAVGYCRFSSDNQREESIDAQKRAITEYAVKTGLIIIDWYVDEAQSAKTDKRIAFQRMVKDGETQKFSQILVHKMDRFSRNILDFLSYEKKFQDLDIEIIYVAQPEMNNKFVKMMYAVMAEQFLDNLAFETLKGMKENAYNGKLNGGQLPYGFKRVKRLNEYGLPIVNKKGIPQHEMAIHAEQAEGVKIMFDMILEGKKRFEIINRLNELGYKRADGKDFTGTSIDNILRNEKYTGTSIFHFGKQKKDYDPDVNVIRAEGKIPQIISKEKFEAVQRILKQRVREPVNTKTTYLLTGKIYCGECGKQYIGMKQKGYLYYKCSEQLSYKNGQRQEEYCHNNSIRKDDVEKFVLKQIKKILLNENIIEDMLEEYYFFEKEISANASLIQMLERQIKDLDDRIDNLTSAISEGRVNQVLFDRIDSFEREKKITEEKLEKERSGINHIFATKAELEKAYKNGKDVLENGTLGEKKTLLQNFINKIFVYKDHVEIYLNLVPMMLCGYLDMEINNQEVMTLNNFVQKQKIIEDENGIYSSVSAFGESKKGQEDNKKEQPTQSSVVQFPSPEDSSGQDSIWLPLLDSNQRPIG